MKNADMASLLIIYLGFVEVYVIALTVLGE